VGEGGGVTCGLAAKGKVVRHEVAYAEVSKAMGEAVS